MDKKIRLDQLLVEKGLVESREKGKRTIMAGLVYSNQQKLDKAGLLVDRDIAIEVKGKENPFVSRGGLKLKKALEVFNIDLKDKVIVDVGASTGGFTDCSLQNGARLVYSVDVGYGQLAWTLRNNPKVINMERTNFRHVEKQQFDQVPEVAVIDASFISLKLLLPKVKEILAQDGIVLALIKPQFEAGRDKVGKKGVVRDFQVHKGVIQDVIRFCLGISLYPIDLSFSPITGPEGNIEYLLYAKINEVEETINDDKINSVVEEAKKNFN